MCTDKSMHVYLSFGIWYTSWFFAFCRLCFVKDICSELKDITRLSQIAELEKKSMFSIINKVKVLRIKGVGNEMGWAFMRPPCTFRIPYTDETLFKCNPNVHFIDGVRFTAWLKEERDDFCLLIEEMWAGKIVSDSTKDIHAIQKAAQNVLLVDALLQRYRIWLYIFKYYCVAEGAIFGYVFRGIALNSCCFIIPWKKNHIALFGNFWRYICRTIFIQ